MNRTFPSLAEDQLSHPLGWALTTWVAARTWRPRSPSAREVELGGQWTPHTLEKVLHGVPSPSSPLRGTSLRVPRRAAPGTGLRAGGGLPHSGCPARVLRAGPLRVKRGSPTAAAEPGAGLRAQSAGSHLPRGAAARCGAGMRKQGGEGRARARCARGWRRRAERARRGRAGCSRRRRQQVRPAPAAAPAALGARGPSQLRRKVCVRGPGVAVGTAPRERATRRWGRKRRALLCAQLRARITAPFAVPLRAPLVSHSESRPRPARVPLRVPLRAPLVPRSELRSNEPDEGRAAADRRSWDQRCAHPQSLRNAGGWRALGPPPLGAAGGQAPAGWGRGAGRPGARPVGGAVRAGQPRDREREVRSEPLGVGSVAEKWGTMRVSNFRKSL